MRLSLHPCTFLLTKVPVGPLSFSTVLDTMLSTTHATHYTSVTPASLLTRMTLVFGIAQLINTST